MFLNNSSTGVFLHRLRQTAGRCITTYRTARQERAADIARLPETQASQQLQAFLEQQKSGGVLEPTKTASSSSYLYTFPQQHLPLLLDSLLTTFCLHVESRIASLLNYGYYTIGPCGEEGLASLAFCLNNDTDSVALHYRHLGVTIARGLLLLGNASLEDIVMDRARAYTVSKHDPITGGVHCCLGSENANDYIVTSTLASQCGAAVGRALGYSLSDASQGPTSTKPQSRRVSFVTLGDGSIHNAHFWSALQLARHAKHKKIKCPVVFGIANNNLSISYKTNNYVNTLFHDKDDPLLPVHTVNGNDVYDVYSQTKWAVETARKQQTPVIVIYQELARRFGHAATDRQSAYLSEAQIQELAGTRNLEHSILQIICSDGSITLEKVLDRYKYIQELVVDCFARASAEDKVTRQEMVERVSAPMVPIPPSPARVQVENSHETKNQVMRKHMTAVLAETLENQENVVYLGEDVVHGGYYVVTEGLAERFPGRIIDFPPDETSLLGAALGLSQVGKTPIVEIPYAKYLDCGFDMFQEIAIQNWLSNGRQRAGMVIRLQGFDRGLFGGNFHTSNTLYTPPGVDVVCYSNGEDYVQGFRHAILQAQAGRVVMSVDCTHLLNLRHLHDKDRGWERPYPVAGAMLGFHDIRRYGTDAKSAIVTYGNGVVTALQARKKLVEDGICADESDLDIVDCPYLSSVPDGLCDALPQYEQVVFADICKEGNGILASHACSLQNKGLLPNTWTVVAAPRTYNPLGSTCTFLNASDIIDSFIRLQNQQ